MRPLIWKCLAVLTVAMGPVLAADAPWPEKPVTFVLASAAGGSADVLTRVVLNELAKEAGANFVIENRPGAAGSIGMAALKRAAPNGYTLGYGNINTLAVNPAIFKKLPYDATNDFEPVGHMFSVYNVLAVRADHPAKSLAELVDMIKKSPGRLSYGAAGIGSSGHMGGELFKSMAKIDAVFVPYQGDPASLQDLLGGRIEFTISNSSVVTSMIEAGKLRALAITAPKRVPMYPALPTFDESGLKGYENVSWGGIVAPKGTSPNVIAKLNASLNKALQSETTRKNLAELGATPGGGSQADFKQLIVREQKKYRDLVETAKIEKID